jgi:hypothetical protein
MYIVHTGTHQWQKNTCPQSSFMRCLLLGQACCVMMVLALLAALSYSLAHLAVPYGRRQDSRLEPKYIQHGLVATSHMHTAEWLDGFYLCNGWSILVRLYGREKHDDWVLLSLFVFIGASRLPFYEVVWQRTHAFHWVYQR